MGDLGCSLRRGLGYLTSLRYTYLILGVPEGLNVPQEVRAGDTAPAERLPGNPCGPRTLDGATAVRLRSQSPSG